mmetsp:Transcript_34361/g.63521  ORF Transcript_34361/g.63521 Transcript_34361/m.63521 type:complete len:113 (+) Transcript_34361:224-562(+)
MRAAIRTRGEPRRVNNVGQRVCTSRREQGKARYLTVEAEFEEVVKFQRGKRHRHRQQRPQKASAAEGANSYGYETTRPPKPIAPCQGRKDSSRTTLLWQQDPKAPSPEDGTL